MFSWAVYKNGMGTLGRVLCEDLELGGVKRATWGHQELDAGTCGMGTRDVKYRDAGTIIFIF